MALSNQVIDKILSFDYKQLKEWIKKRLHGNDEFFPLYLGQEPNFSEFIINVFLEIEDEKFRNNFIEILGKLVGELRDFTRNQIECSKDYIIELLKLCGNIRQFDYKDYLMEIAVSGKFKGIKIDEESDLHADLLTTLASYKIVGSYRFWIDQMWDDADRYYANPAFYALMDNLDKLFEHINIFIDKFSGEIELEWGIEALLNDYGKKAIVKRFRDIEVHLSLGQREAVDQAFIELGENPVFKFKTASGREIQHLPEILRLKVAMPTIPYGTGDLAIQEAVKIFRLMGFDVELHRYIADHYTDIFLKKKKNIGDRYECWICFCEGDRRKVSKNMIQHLYPIREDVREELANDPGPIVYDDCQLLIISEKGFTRGAIEAAKVYGMELTTLDRLHSDLRDSYTEQYRLLREFNSFEKEKED